MREGDLVVVAGQLNEIHCKDLGEQPIGTVVHIDRTVVWVLFSNGILWVGPAHHTYPPQN